jgi:hypothetical protein
MAGDGLLPHGGIPAASGAFPIRPMEETYTARDILLVPEPGTAWRHSHAAMISPMGRQRTLKGLATRNPTLLYQVGVRAGLPSACSQFLVQAHGVGFPASVEAGGGMSAHLAVHGRARGSHHVFQRAYLLVEVFVGFHSGLGGWKPPPRLFSQPPTIRPHLLSRRVLNSNCFGTSKFRSLAMRTTVGRIRPGPPTFPPNGGANGSLAESARNAQIHGLCMCISPSGAVRAGRGRPALPRAREPTWRRHTT